MHVFTHLLLITTANAVLFEKFIYGKKHKFLISRTGIKEESSGIFCDKHFINGIRRPLLILDKYGCVNIEFIAHKSVEFKNIDLRQRAYEKLGQSAGKHFQVYKKYSAIPTLRFRHINNLYGALFGTQFASFVELSLVYEYVKSRINFLNTEIIHGDMNPRNIMVDKYGSVFFKNFQNSTGCADLITQVKGDQTICSRFYETHLEKTFGRDLLLFKAEYVDKFILAGSIIVRHDAIKKRVNRDDNYLRMIQNVWNDFVWYLKLDPDFMNFGYYQGVELMNEFYASKYYSLYFASLD